jgi:hypothetical protein
MDAPRQPWLRLPRRFADYRKREETKQPRGAWPTSPKRFVQEAQRARIAGLAVDDARERAVDERDRAADEQV